MKTLRLTALWLLLPCSLLAQTVPPLVNYQGRLSNPDGSLPATGNYQLSFKVFDAASGGNLIWGPETFDGNAGQGHGALIPVVQGYFNVLLGPADINGASLAGAFNGTNRFMEVTVTNHAPIAPRQQILTTPFAFQAGSAANAALASNVVSGINITNGLITNSVFGGNGGGLTNLNASQLASGIVSAGNLPANLQALTTNNAVNLTNLPAAALPLALRLLNTNNGGALTNLNASQISSGVISQAQLPAAINALTVTNFSLAGPAATIMSGTSLLLRSDGAQNFFSGLGAGNVTGSGGFNTATGTGALSANTFGADNTAAGYQALHSNAGGAFNMASGYQALFSATSANFNTASGVQALYSDTTGGFNTANGGGALYFNNGYFNTASGYQALYENTSGWSNTATGYQTLYNNTTGLNNTANGAQALFSNTIGSLNTAVGYEALYSNTNGSDNMASGYAALYANTTGSFNTASGLQALFNNTTANAGTADGYQALFNNTTGSNNTATGYAALYFNTNGSYNTANGVEALFSNTSGSNNAATGISALIANTTGNNNTAIGNNALVANMTGSQNIALGYNAGYQITGNNNIDIGNQGNGADSGIIHIGTTGVQVGTTIAGIFGDTAASGVAVYINSSGQLGTLTSSARFKTNIASMDDASDVLLSLHPVTFRYRPELDPQHIPQFGLVAEEVDKVDPDLVARDDKNQIYTVRYEAVNAMLLNEFLKEHSKVQEQNTEIHDLQQRLDALEKIVLGKKSK